MKYTVTEQVLKGGSRGLIISVPGAPVMSSQFHFRAGNRYVKDSAHKWETAHIMEHMAFGANDGFKSAHEYDAVFTKNGAFHNAFTSDISMTYVADCADFEWDRILGLQRTAICEPLFMADEFAGEFGNVKSELTGYLSQPDWVLWPRIAQSLGEETMTVQESLDIMNDITVDDIRDHWRRTHTAGNMRFVVAGNFDGRLTKLRDILRSWELRGGDRPPIPVDELHGFSPFAIRRKDVPSISFGWSMNVTRRLSDDETMAMDVLNHILNGTLHSRIQGQARKRGLAYYIWSKTSSFAHNSSWEFGSEINPDKLSAVVDLIVAEMRRIKDGDIADEEIAAAKSYAIGRHQMGIQTVSQLAYWLANRYFFDGSVEDFAAQPDRINAVTRERIVDIAREFFAGNCWGLGLYGNTEKAVAERLNEKLVKLF
jgi:predicted Zn-dependent peptidase